MWRVSSTLMYVALHNRAQTDSCLSLLLTTCWIRLHKDDLNPHMPSERCYRWLITTGTGCHLSQLIACSSGLRWSVHPICASVPDAVANSMSLLLALRISSFFSVSSSARQQMISSLWKNKHTQYDEQTPESRCNYIWYQCNVKLNESGDCLHPVVKMISIYLLH